MSDWGGGGILLWACLLLQLRAHTQGGVPPSLGLHLGSPGFLTHFNFQNFQTQVTPVIQGNAAIVLRSWLKIKVVKKLRGKKTAMSNGVMRMGSRPPTGT